MNDVTELEINPPDGIENSDINAENEAYRAKIQRKKRKAVVGQVIAYLVILFTAFLLIFPFWLKVVESLMSTSFVREYKLYWWTPGGKLYFKNYIEAWEVGDFLVGFKNTIYFAVMSTVIATIFAFIAGYVFGKMQFRGKDIVFMLMLSSMMVPGEVLLVPLFVIVKTLNLYNSVEGAFLPGLFNVFGVF
jgi:multiple sugar transport system permease protein